MRTPVHLQDWFVRFSPNRPYAAPEVSSTCLAGIVTGHPRKRDGKHVITSRIAAAEGRVVTTKSGTRYRLGCINRKYRRWLRKQKLEYKPKQPVTVKV
jgi:hypothetical protein